MIRVTIWYEKIEEDGALHAEKIQGEDDQSKAMRAFLMESEKMIKKVHPDGMLSTLKSIFEGMDDVSVTGTTMDMPEMGLPDGLLNETDVLIWWAHVAHDQVPDALAEKIRQRVLTGMGFIPLHSSHPCKPLQKLLGTTGSLGWREDDYCRMWNVNPTHPIARGIPESFELGSEEMYCEYFDVPKPDDLIFISWYRGGEVFRSGLTWTRGYGKIFYFQPGHETNPSYYNPYVRRILQNAVRWAAPEVTIEKWECPHIETPHEGR